MERTDTSQNNLCCNKVSSNGESSEKPNYFLGVELLKTLSVNLWNFAELNSRMHECSVLLKKYFWEKRKKKKNFWEQWYKAHQEVWSIFVSI